MRSHRPAKSVTWVVGEGDGRHVGEILTRLDCAVVQAVADGRVFISGRRVSSPHAAVRPGNRVELFPPREASGAIELLGERDGILAVAKPAGLPTEPDRRGNAGSFIHRLAAQLGVPASALHACNRLDLGVSGVILVASSARARRELSAARHRHGLQRRYLAIAARAPVPPRGRWSASLTATRTHGSRFAVDDRTAHTNYACVATANRSAAEWEVVPGGAAPALLAIEPITGRGHQIRIHAAGAGAPLIGDRAGGGPMRLTHRDGAVEVVHRIALHAARIKLTDSRGEWRVEAPTPKALIDVWCKVGGQEGDCFRVLAGEQL